jgi:hypothetical protein
MAYPPPSAPEEAPAEEPADAPAEDPAEDPAEAPADEPAEEPAEADDPAEEEFLPGSKFPSIVDLGTQTFFVASTFASGPGAPAGIS